MDKQCTVQVKLELGHHAQLRKKPTTEGFMHDWMVFVRGPEQCEIQHFVEKVVFRLHSCFPKPKRVCKEPPYQVEESWYIGFIMPIEVYLKNKEEPRKVCFSYDLFLNLEGNPPVNYLRCEKLTFNNPTLEFRCKLLKAGGVMVMPEGAETLSRPSPDYPMLPTIPLSAFSDPKKTKPGHGSKDTKMTLKEPKLESLSPKGGPPPKVSGKRLAPADSPKPGTKKPKKSGCKSSRCGPAVSPRASASSFSDKKPAKDKGGGKGGYKSNPREAKKVPDMEESNSEDETSFKTESAQSSLSGSSSGSDSDFEPSQNHNQEEEDTPQERAEAIGRQLPRKQLTRDAQHQGGQHAIHPPGSRQQAGARQKDKRDTDGQAAEAGSRSQEPIEQVHPTAPFGEIDAQQDMQMTEDMMCRYLTRKPMTTKDLLNKFQTKKMGLSSKQMVNMLAQIRNKIHFSLKD